MLLSILLVLQPFVSLPAITVYSGQALQAWAAETQPFRSCNKYERAESRRTDACTMGEVASLYIEHCSRGVKSLTASASRGLKSPQDIWAVSLTQSSWTDPQQRHVYQLRADIKSFKSTSASYNN